MRQTLEKNYILLRNMLDETHLLKAHYLLTSNYKTSKAAHQRLEILLKIKYERAMKIEYGL
jgi:hypothetical protein